MGLVAVVCALPAEGQVIINELMYNPVSGQPRDEYIELHNTASTNVNVSNWRISRGVDYVIPNGTAINAGGYLIIAGHRPSFLAKYPGVSPVVGDFVQMVTRQYPDRMLTNWVNTLSNSRNRIDLLDADGDEIDSVEYADEGEWAIRQRDPFDSRGWIWWSAADGNGSSLELMNPNLPNEYGQNWAASSIPEGTPGSANSVFSANVAPLILNAQHLPPVPTSSETVAITARMLNEQSSGVQVSLFYRASVISPGPFTSVPMLDNGTNGDGAAGDGLYGALVPPQPNDTVIEFYIQAQDAQANVRTWPAPAFPGPVQEANALYQVDDNPQNRYGAIPSLQPMYKLIMTEAERAIMVSLHQSGSQSDAQMNTTFISLDGTETLVRYLVGTRNRGNSSRGAGNYRVNFRSDDRWKGVTAMNFNRVQQPLQHFGSTLALKAGAVGAQSRAVQMRLNNVNQAPGSYAANEVYNGEWADRHYPSNPGGNVYRVQRNIDPSEFDYRGENPSSYQNTYFKSSNTSENDWQDIVGLHAVMGLNGIVLFEAENIQTVIDPAQWLRHIAVMSLIGNSESGINSGHNDDYFMYRGVNDPRFVLLYHDLDQLFGIGGQAISPQDGVFGATTFPPRGTSDNDGIGRMLNRFMHTPAYEMLYYQILQELLDTTFSKPQFDVLLDQTLGPYVGGTTINQIINWMDQRRAHVQSLISPFIQPSTPPPLATITGVPRARTPSRNVTLTVGGAGITHYRYRLNNTTFQPVAPVSQPIQLSNLPQGSTNFVVVVGMTNNTSFNPGLGVMSRTWVVDTNTPSIRINEILARNDAAYNHETDFPDIVELYNEGSNTVDISGMRLTDDPSDPHKFAFPPGTTVTGGGYLVTFADDRTTSGIHLGYNLNQAGDDLYLYDTPAKGGALVDSVQFGLQAADLSLGRVGSEGAWILGSVTIGGANISLTLGEATSLKINEWLTAGTSPFADDFVEIHNPIPLPVSIGGMYLTDNRIGAPMQSRLRDLSFIAGEGHIAFIADGTTNDALHVNFQLASEQGEIFLLSSSLATIDCVSYGPQRLNVPVGRCPDATGPITSLPLATPGLPNACPGPPPGATTNNIFVVNSTWRYNTNSVSASWKDRLFNDSSWLSGNAVLYGGSRPGSIPDTIRTALAQPATPGSVTFVPLGHSWRYHTAGVEFAGWQNRIFDDSGWSSGAALLYNGPRPQNINPIEPIRTTLPPAPGRPIAYYYRGQFTIAPGTTITGLQLEHVIDDGAVFYLNGNEVVRFNMPLSGTIASNTLASPTVVDAQLVGPTNISVTNLVVGVNVLAVETHQTGLGGADVTMGARLTAVVSNDARNTYYFRQRFTLPADFTATQLQITHLVDDGAVFYLNGSEIGRFNMPTGIVTDTTLPTTRIGDATYQILTVAATGLLPGDNVLAVQVHQRDTSDSDVCLGIRLDAITATNGAAGSGIVISEVFANNATTFIETNITPTGTNITTPDLIELYNPSNGGVDLSNCSLTDDPLIPRRWVFPTGSIITPRGYMVVKFDADAPASTNLVGIPNTGFGLSADGEPRGLYLINSPGGGGGVLDSIVFGIQTADCSVSRVPNTSSNWTLTLPTLGATNNLPVSLGNPLNLRVNEWLANPVSGEDDWFEIYNPNAQPVALGGLYLTDVASTPDKHKITQLSFIGFGSNAWQRFWADRNLDAGADHVDFRLSASEEDVALFTAALAQIDAIHFVGQQIGISEGRLPDGGENKLKFPGTASPGDPNYAALTNIVINEVLAHSDPPLEDAIELRNLTASPINVGGWWLSDAKRTPRKYQLPNRTIPGNGFTVFYEYEFNNIDNTPTPFSLSSANGDEVYLSAATNGGVSLTGYRAVADFGPSANAVSMGPYRNSQGFEEFVALSQMTFGGGTNTLQDFRSGMGQANTYPKVGPIVITEIMYHPPDIGTNDNVVEEFIEIYNAGSTSVPLFDVAHPTNRWRLRDAVDFDFPPNRSIPSGGYLLVVSFDPLSNPAALAAFQTRYGSNSALVGPYQGKLDNSSDSVELYKPDPPQTIFGPDFGRAPYILVEKVVYGDRTPWPTNADGGGRSLQRRFNDGFANDVTNWVAATPSPGPAGAGDTDRDDDGMPNDWEEAYDLNPDNPNDWDDDADQDGVINLREYLAGTDPTDPDSYLAVESVSVTGGTVAISFTAIAGKTYTLEYRDSLLSGDWAALQHVPAPSSTGVITLYDNPGGGPAQRYYRLVTPQQ